MEKSTAPNRRTASLPPGFTVGAPALRRPVLLVVDDDEPLREALRLIFEYQFEIWRADSGSLALSLIERGKIDVAIVDLRMPGMSGMEFLERSRALDPDIQAVIVSGQSTFEMARQAVRFKVFDFLPKPFDLQVLRQTIQQAARHRAWVRIERQREAADRRARAEGEAAKHERNLLASRLHELVSPLAMVAHGARLLDQEIARTPEPRTDQLGGWRRRLQDLNAQAAICGELVARPQPDLVAGGGSEGVLASQVMDNLLRLLRSHPTARGNMLTIRPPALPVSLLARESDLLSILVHLGRNALECSALPHRVEIESWLVSEPASLGTTERSQGRFVLRDTFLNQPPLLAISLKDDGPGITDELWPGLFQELVTTKAGPGDSGLGLTVVRDLVAAGNCALELRTTPGAGTTVTLYVSARRLTGAV